MTAIATDGPRLRRSLNLWQVTISGIGIVIGAGIYVLIGEGIREAGAGVWLSFLLAALLSGMTALSYCELAGMYPSAGVEYEWSKRAFNPFVGFMAGWMMAVAYVIAAAAVSIGFGHYAQHFLDVDAGLAAVMLLAVLTVVVISGVERSIWLSVLLAGLQIGGLILVIVAGAPHIGDRPVLEGATISGVVSGAALVFFAFIGFDDIATLSEETRDAATVIPRALILTLAISASLYVLVGLSAISVVDASVLAESETPLSLVVEHNWGTNGADIVAVIALASTMNTTLLVLTAAARLLYAMGRSGALPALFARIGARGHAPYVGALVTFVIAAAFAAGGDIGLVAAVTDFAVYCTFLSVNLAVIALRFRAPEAARPYRTPWAVAGVPVLAVLGTVSILGMIAFLHPPAIVLGVGALMVGVAVFAALRATGRNIDEQRDVLL
jgi:APA family basic amino acid/polyamine antiporter